MGFGNGAVEKYGIKNHRYGKSINRYLRQYTTNIV